MQTLRVDAEARPFAAGDDDGADPAADALEDVARARASASSALPSPVSQTELALLDIARGARARHLWGLLGWQDIRRRYRRSVLGPFWLTISMGVLVAVLGTLYGNLLKVETAVYVPHLALGLILWALISSLTTDGGAVFTGAERIIKQTNLPLSIHVYRLVWRHLLVLCHNAAIFVVVAAVFSIWPGWTGLLAVPGLVLLCLNGMWMAFFLGIVSARFRDVPPIVASVVRIAFFVTPIIWMPGLLTGRAAKMGPVLDFNPFYHFLELVRAPLLGQVPGLASWLVVSGMTLVGWWATFVLFRRYRRRIAYWV